MSSSTVDANVLLYASDTSSEHHERALAFLGERTAGPDLLYLFWPVVMAYLRIATHPRVFERPLDVATAMGNIDGLLRLSHVRTGYETDRFWDVFQSVADTSVRGNLVPDAHVVALMREHGVGVIWTHDRDFRRFDAIRVRDPFEAKSRR